MRPTPLALHTVFLLLTGLLFQTTCMAQVADADLERLQIKRGILGVIGLPNGDANYLAELCNKSELTVFFQAASDSQALAARQAGSAAKLLGTRLFVDIGSAAAIHLSDNVADRWLVDQASVGETSIEEVLRSLRPGGVAFLGERSLVKPTPVGIDDWSHPYHGPDNNPSSTDQLARGELRTQFIGYPKFSPMPEQTVVAGGRIYKAMGHIAHKANQNEMLNTLLCINAYNGTILWKRELSEGFMLHRNTMIATDDALYMGDHESCKVIDGVTGEVRDEIKVDPKISDGPVWKWMAMRDGVLYGLVGNPEIKIETQRSARRGLGHWPWGMWDGHDYDDARTAFGFGRTLVAIDLETQKLLWHYRDDDFLDARAVCMNDDQIFCFCPQKFLASIDIKTGKLTWKSGQKEMLDAVGGNERAQHYVTGYATTCYVKCNNDYLFFAGPQRSKMVVASAVDGKLAWTHPTGNLQLVLRDDGIWAAGSQKSDSGVKLDYKTGKILDKFPARRACTRATGSVDSIFYRANGGTVRIMADSNVAQHIAPMRPPCQDGVIISNGHFYWGPWMCGCQLSIYANIGLRPDVVPPRPEAALAIGRAERHRVAVPMPSVPSLQIRKHDWPAFRGNNARTDVTTSPISASGLELQWSAEVSRGVLPTAPVSAGGFVFVADRSGAVRALNEEGDVVWTSYTAGPIYYPPAVAHDRIYVGSADGRVYSFAARTGEFLWSYSVGPSEQWIPVYDQLISSWPVAGGVVVEGDRVYAAAGITHYDGTHVVALDAITGRLVTENDSSGKLQAQVNNGISLQGNLRVVEDELQFLAGGVYEVAQYDLKSLECRNEPRTQVFSEFRTAFYAYYPSYGKYVSLDFQCDDGCSLTHDASYEGSRFASLTLSPARPPGTPKTPQEEARWIRRGGARPGKPVWQDTSDRRFTSFVISADRLLATGNFGELAERPFLMAIDTQTGKDLWSQQLSVDAVKAGTATSAGGRVYVSLENGKLLCFADKSSANSR
jgi:outer membrane protein assembly factor BamB